MTLPGNKQYQAWSSASYLSLVIVLAMPAISSANDNPFCSPQVSDHPRNGKTDVVLSPLLVAEELQTTVAQAAADESLRLVLTP